MNLSLRASNSYDVKIANSGGSHDYSIHNCCLATSPKEVMVTNGKIIVISNGNMIEWSPIRSVIIRVITQVLLLINHKNYNFPEKKNSQVM